MLRWLVDGVHHLIQCELSYFVSVGIGRIGRPGFIRFAIGAGLPGGLGHVSRVARGL